MSENIFAPGKSPNSVMRANGEVVEVPAGWELLPPGDALLTRRVKGGRRTLGGARETRSKDLFARRVGTCCYDRSIACRVRCGAKHRELRQTQGSRRKTSRESASRVCRGFRRSRVAYLHFHPAHREIASKMARAITQHATPVGSGTVARTKRIPIEQRAEAAVIAWMRHQTTAYDTMQIARVKGERREVRRMLAQRSKQLLNEYRTGAVIKADCPLKTALDKTS